MAFKIETDFVMYLLLVFNVLFWLTGTSLFAIGLWLGFNHQAITIFDLEGTNKLFYTEVSLLILSGTLVMGVGFLGCCGAIKLSWRILAFYIGCLLVISILTIAVGVMSLSRREEIIGKLQTFYKDTHRNYLATKNETFLQTLKDVHYALSCCGIDDNMEHVLIPTCPEEYGSIYSKSCPRAIDEFFNFKFRLIGGMGMWTGVFVVVGITLCILLLCALRSNKQQI